jgi:hypothetical protein
MSIRIRPLGTIALVTTAAAAPSAAATAASPSELQAKVRAALLGAHSFVETVTIKPNAIAPLGGTMTFTVVAPNRYHQLVSSSLGGGDDTIIIGNQVYGRAGKGWTVQTWSDRLVTGFEGDTFDVDVVSVGPDETRDGKTVGTFVMKDPRGAKDSDTLSCTYDRATFLPLHCENGFSTIAYAYGDPGVSIETPKNPVRLDK